jgi:hypothetical protein
VPHLAREELAGAVVVALDAVALLQRLLLLLLLLFLLLQCRRPSCVNIYVLATHPT